MDEVETMKRAWDSWQEARTKEEKEISRIGFHILLEGEPVPPSRLAEELGWSQEKVVTELRRMGSEGRCTLNNSDALTGIMGLSVVTAPHQLRLQGKTFFTWCALDAVAIPAALQIDADVKSRTSDGDSDIALHFQNGKWTPQEVWVQLVEPKQGTSLCGDT